MTLLMCLSMWTLFLSNLFLLTHPLLLTMNVLMLALMTCLSLSSLTIWYAYMLFMVFVGGLLVIFMYIASLAPNAIFTMNKQTLPIMSQAMMTVMLFLMNTPIHTNPITSLPSSTKETARSLAFFFLDQNLKLLIFAATALILSMMIVMSLFKSSDGAMRPFLNVNSTKTNNSYYPPNNTKLWYMHV